MKILFISNLYPPNVVGGYERLCHQVAAALGERGHEIHVLTSTFGERRDPIEGQTVRRALRLLADDQDIYKPFEADATKRDEINRHNVAELSTLVAGLKPDLIFCWNLYFLDYSFLDAVAGCGVPSVLFLTDNWLIAALTPDRIHEHFARHVRGDQPFVPAAPTPDRLTPAHVMFGSNFIRDLYSQCGYSFLSTAVVHNGVEPPNQDDTLAPDRLAPYRPGELRLLFAGRMVDIKGPQDCVAAVSQIQKSLGQSARVRLTLIGDTLDAAFSAKLRAQIADSGVADQISMIDPVSEGELIDMFNTHDMLLFPSHFEPFALTLILAMAAGIPVVASDIGGNPEIVLDRKTGLLFRKGDIRDLSDKVLELWRDPPLRARLAGRGRRFARRFTFGRMISQIEHGLQVIVQR